MADNITNDPISVETLRWELNWDNITQGYFSDGTRNWPVYVVHPDNPDWPTIKLFSGPSGIHEICVGDDGAHFHAGQGTEQALEIARDLVTRKKSVVVTYFDNGVLESWKLVAEDGWPDTFLKHDMPLDESGAADLADLDGNRYLPPKYIRIVFNREPFADAPDFSSYIPVKCGWMTPQKRDAIIAAMELSGDTDNFLI